MNATEYAHARNIEKAIELIQEQADNKMQSFYKITGDNNEFNQAQTLLDAASVLDGILREFMGNCREAA